MQKLAKHYISVKLTLNDNLNVSLFPPCFETAYVSAQRF